MFYTTSVCFPPPWLIFIILFFWCYRKWNVLISFLSCSLLVYRNITDFCMLNLYPESWLNLLVIVRIFRGFIHIKSCCLQTENFSSFFSIWIPLTYLFSLIILATTLSTMLKRSGESRHPCLVPDFGAKASIFHHQMWC